MEFGIESEEMLEKALPYFVFSYNAVEVDEENAGIYGNIGILIASTYMTKGEITESIEWIERIMTDYPDYIPVIGWASYLYLGLEEYDKAVELATKADMEGNLQGTFVLGYCMAYGKGILKNELGGFKKIRKAALSVLLTVPHILWRNAIITEWVQKSISRKQKNGIRKQRKRAIRMHVSNWNFYFENIWNDQSLRINYEDKFSCYILHGIFSYFNCLLCGKDAVSDKCV